MLFKVAGLGTNDIRNLCLTPQETLAMGRLTFVDRRWSRERKRSLVKWDAARSQKNTNSQVRSWDFRLWAWWDLGIFLEKWKVESCV